MKKILISILAICSISITANAQTIADYSFESYPSTRNLATQKAKINYASNPDAKYYKTRINSSYKTSKIDFASYYITTIWGCGTGCITGAMVDVRDGQIYDLPLGEDTSSKGCFSDDKTDEGVTYTALSRLFIRGTCGETEIENTSSYKQEQKFFINVWNEPKKKFELVKTVEKTDIKKKTD
jgi:hypothetical protein